MDGERVVATKTNKSGHHAFRLVARRHRALLTGEG